MSILELLSSEVSEGNVIGEYFLNSTRFERHDDVFMFETLNNTEIESNVSSAVRRMVRSYRQNEISQNAVDALSDIIRRIDDYNQKIVRFFEYSHVFDQENELEINFESEEFEECCLSVYYDDDLNNESSTFLSYCRRGEYYVINGSVNSVMRNFNRIFNETTEEI